MVQIMIVWGHFNLAVWFRPRGGAVALRSCSVALFAKFAGVADVEALGAPNVAECRGRCGALLAVDKNNDAPRHPHLRIMTKT